MTDPDVPTCRAGCGRVADGYDGFCEPCARERERDGRWETIPLEETEQESTTAPDDATDEAGSRLYLRGA